MENTKEKRNKKIKNKSIELIILLMMVFLAIMNIVLSFVLNSVQRKHDSISYFIPDYNKARVEHHNAKKELMELKEKKAKKAELKNKEEQDKKVQKDENKNEQKDTNLNRDNK